MSARFRLHLVGVSLLFLCALSARAQVSASISGRVTDQTGAVVAGATVTAKSLDTGVSRSTPTDQAGRYELIALSIGQFEVRAARTALRNASAPASFSWWVRTLPSI
ncbi:MAG TPA: carboxypeptidase-like regulatory domain-containing protein [Candidatus Limnocylindrales bacterium]|jgi:protocatechuate 3,4-dioxygenase beta subunit|nr:carboxypeptidase-like regulatory domain-containing protein [Candidatus Limnocylindrales bacterium]